MILRHFESFRRCVLKLSDHSGSVVLPGSPAGPSRRDSVLRPGRYSGWSSSREALVLWPLPGCGPVGRGHGGLRGDGRGRGYGGD